MNFTDLSVTASIVTHGGSNELRVLQGCQSLQIPIVDVHGEEVSQNSADLLTMCPGICSRAALVMHVVIDAFVGADI